MVILHATALAGCALFDEGEWTIGRVEVSSDTNEDGRLTPGETATIEVFLSGGEGESYQARSEVSSETAGVVIDNEPRTSSGPSDTVVVLFRVTIEPTIEVGTLAQFALGLSFFDGSGGDSTLSFALPLEATGALPVITAVIVTSDDNGDGIANKSESISLDIQIENQGTSKIPGAQGVLLSADSLVTVTQDQGSYWDIDAGETSQRVGGHFRVEIDEATPAGHAASLTLQLVDDLGASWALPVNLTIHATGALISFSRKEIYSDDNDDGILDAGESARLRVWIKNAGTSEAQGVRAVLSAADDRLTVTSGADGLSYWDLEPGEEGQANTTFGVEVDPETPSGHAFELFLTITDRQANVWTDTFTITEGAEDLELTLDDWQVEEVGGDGDGVVSVGEVGRLAITIRNAGAITAREVKATLASEDRHLRIDTDQVRVGNVGVNGTAPGESPFRFTVLASHPAEPMAMDVTLSSGRYSRTTRILVPLGSGR
jgi:hypothetical protein